MKTLGNIFLFVFAVAVTTAAMEFYLQIAEIQTPMETRIDEEIGPTFIAGKKVTRFNEGFYVGGVNEYGYLGPAYPPRKEGDEYRILLLGDSFVMGMTLFNRHHFARVLERDLPPIIGREVEVLNFGKADFNIGNMYQYYLDYASKFEHDLVLLFVGRGDLIPARQTATALFPTCAVEDGKVTIDYGFRDSPEYQRYKRVEPISEHSSFFRLAFNTRKMISRRELPDVLLDKFARFVPKQPRKRNQRDIGSFAQEWTLPILRELGRNSKIHLVTTRELRPEVNLAVQESGIPTIDLVPLFTELENNGVDPYFWKVTGEKGHWNHETHQEMGRFLVQEIARLRQQAGI